MEKLLNSIVDLLKDIAPEVKDLGTSNKIIDLIADIIPVAVDEAKDLVDPIKAIIEALRGSGVPDEEQLARLDELDEEADAEFEDAAKKWEE